MTREEAIRILASSCIPGSKQTEALETLIPELAESEDERIRKALVWHLKADVDFVSNGVTKAECLAYLEKQKEQSWMPTEEEMGVLYKLCYVSNQISDDDDTELTRLYQDLKREYFNGRSFENMFPKAEKEQKPAESISQLTVQGKGVYKICPRCKERMVRDDSMVYTSMPPQYRYECPKCGESECDTVMYDNPEMEEQKPAEWSEKDIKKIRSEEYTKGFNDAAFGGKLKEWSVEDEDRIRQIERIAQQAGCTQKLQEEIHDWLKSLRPFWKPSEEQMKALLNIEGDLRAFQYNDKAKIIAELYEQLKRL